MHLVCVTRMLHEGLYCNCRTVALVREATGTVMLNVECSIEHRELRSEHSLETRDTLHTLVISTCSSARLSGVSKLVRPSVPSR